MCFLFIYFKKKMDYSENMMFNNEIQNKNIFINERMVFMYFYFNVYIIIFLIILLCIFYMICIYKFELNFIIW